MMHDGLDAARREIDAALVDHAIERETLFMIARGQDDFDDALEKLMAYCDQRKIRLVGPAGR